MRKLCELKLKAADVCGGEEAEFMTLIREISLVFLSESTVYLMGFLSNIKESLYFR